MKFAILTIFASLSVALSCDCGFMDGLSCGTDVVSCVSSCKGGVSSKCISCVEGLGTKCCKCVAKAVGEISSDYGNKICGYCDALGSAESETTSAETSAETSASARQFPAKDSQSSSQCTVKDACKDSTPEQRPACLVELSRNLANEALKLGFQVPPARTHTIVTPGGEAVHFKQHELGCPFLHFGCYFRKGKCDICKKVVPHLRGITSQTTCSAKCVALSGLIGAGVEDPVSDAVVAKCPEICSAETQTNVGWWSASHICSYAGVC